MARRRGGRPAALGGRLTSSEALWAALEDPGTVEFVRACFALPEERPKIFFRKLRLGRNTGRFWRVAIIEKPLAASGRAVPLFNLAIVDVDDGDGTVLGRRFYRNLLAGEIRRAISLGIPPGDCKDRSP